MGIAIKKVNVQLNLMIHFLTSWFLRIEHFVNIKESDEKQIGQN